MGDHQFLPSLFKSSSVKLKTAEIQPDPTSIQSGEGSSDKHDHYSIQMESSKLAILSQFINIYPEAVVLLSGSGEILAMNTVFITRYSLVNSNSIISLPFLKLIHERDKLEVARNIQKSMDLKLLTTCSPILLHHVEDIDTQFHPVDVCIQFNSNSDDCVLAIIRYTLLMLSLIDSIMEYLRIGLMTVRRNLSCL